jgi:hypothetical protein
MAEYSMEQFGAYNVARAFGAEQAAAQMAGFIIRLAAEVGEGWATDPRRIALEDALQIFKTQTLGRNLLDEESLAQLEVLNAIDADRDRRLGPSWRAISP